MAYKDKTKQKEFVRSHYLKNREKYIASTRAKESRQKKMVQNLKVKPCVDCGIEYPYYVMQYDHLDGNLKEASLASIYTKGWSDARVMLEISKCDVVCANCHAIRTHKRRNGLLV